MAGVDCTVEHAGANGVFIGDDATVRLAACAIRDSAFTAVHIGGTATVDLLDVNVTGTPEHGVRTTDRSMLRFIGGEIGSARMTALQIEGTSDATVRKVTISDAGVGIRIQDTPHHPLFEECAVSQTAQSGLEAGPGTLPIVRDCTFGHSGAAGIFLDEDSRASIDGCEISEAGGSGLVVWTAAAPTIHATVVRHCRKNGIYLGSGVTALLDECDVSATDSPAVYVADEATPTLRRLRIHDVDQDFELAAEARPLFDQCEVNDVRISTMPADAQARRGCLAAAGSRGRVPGTVAAQIPSRHRRRRCRGAPGARCSPNSTTVVWSGPSRMSAPWSSSCRWSSAGRKLACCPRAVAPSVFACNPGTGGTTIARLWSDPPPWVCPRSPDRGGPRDARG